LPANANAIAPSIGGRPVLTATGTSNAPINGTAGVGQKNSEIKYVETINTT